MIVHPATQRHPHPLAGILSDVVGTYHPAKPIDVPGFIMHSNWNPEFVYALKEHDWEFYELPSGLSTHGVVDTPQQFIERHAGELMLNERRLCVFFVHIVKDPANRGRGGGWRWHKWGTYIGDGDPQWEYLDDEEGFDDGVYTFSIREVP
jgi:hypothetical protein